MRTLIVSLVLLVGCSDPAPRPDLITEADSLAMSIIDGHGGWDAWAALPLLRFDWIVERDSVEVVRMRHLWDREGDRVRVEWPVGEDSMAVAILRLGESTPDAPVGVAWINGMPSTPADSLLHDGYARFINDSYWLVAPFKTLDPGVNRGLAPDSTDRVLALSFDGVGMTPGDRYWLAPGPDGALARWTYLLEGDTTMTTWTWTEPASVEGPAGPVRFLTRKANAAGSAIVTVPKDDIPADAWTSPTPVLQ